MPTIPENPQAALRWSVYWILICLSAGVMLGRILAVDAVDRTALEKDRIAHLDRDLYLAKQSLEKKGSKARRSTRRGRTRKSKSAATPNCAGRSSARTTAADGAPSGRWSSRKCASKGSPYAIDKVIQEPGWDTIDMVKHNGHLYSSKPPLCPTIVAGIYWAIYIRPA